jgi:hypothetical protein
VNLKGTIRLIFAEAAAISINVIPLAFWFFEDYSAETTMLIYAGEAIAAIVFAVLCVLITSPNHDPQGAPQFKRKFKVITDFLRISMSLALGVTILLVSFIVVALQVEIEFRAIGTALLIVLGIQFVEFLVDVLTLRPLPLNKAEYFMVGGMGKSALLFFGVFIGWFLAMFFVTGWFVVPFVIMKLIQDIGEPIQFFLGKGDSRLPVGTELSSSPG